MGAKAKAMATAAGTAVLMYLVLSGRLSAAGEDAGEERRLISSAVSAAAEAREAVRRRRRRGGEEEKEIKWGRRRRRGPRWPERAPASWGEAAAVAARTVRLTYRETLGKWSLGEIAFGIKYYMRQQGNLQHEYAGNGSVPLEGAGVRQELISLLRYLRLCMFFSKKPYEVFLEFGGYGQSDVLIKKSKARVLKPAFTVVRDRSTKCFLLLIRGAISVKDRLTAATGAEVPFHHVVLREGHVSNLVLGYAHCGMVAAARWIANQAIPCLSKAVQQFPDYRVKVIGHSMGAGIAAILTYMLRENEKLSSSTCIAFGPAACMTWDLAESGKEFITTVVNRTDLVPSFGQVSAANLRTEVMASSWVHDLREQIQHTRFLGFVNRSVSFMRSHVPFISNPRSKVVDADMLLHHTSRASEAEMKLSADACAAVKKHSALSCWSCVSAHKQTVESATDPTHDIVNETIAETETEKANTEPAAAELVPVSLGDLNHQEADNEEIDKAEKEAATLKETDEGHADLLQEATADNQQRPSSSSQEPRPLYPPGRIMHMVVLPAPEPNTSEQGGEDEVVALYETPRDLYSKIRLARSMIGDHYMPKYIKTMEMLIDKLGEDDDGVDSL